MIVSGVTASLAFIDAAHRRRRRYAAGAPRPVLARPGRAPDRLAEAARGPAAGATTSTCSPTTCRWTRTPNWATTRSSACAWACRPTPLRRPGPGLHRPAGTCPRCPGAGAPCSRRWARAGAAARRRPAAASHRLVHRRRAGLLRGRHRRRCRRLPDRRAVGAAGPPGARDRRRLPGLRPPRHRALRRAGRGRPGGRAASASSTSSSTSTTRHEAAPLLITMGDAAGIGPEIVVRPFAGPADGCVVVGDVAVLQRAARTLHPLGGAAGADRAARRHRRRAAGLPAGAGATRPARWPGGPALGRVDARCGAAAAACIREAVALVRRGEAAASSPRPSTRRRWRPPASTFPATPRCCRRWPPTGPAGCPGAHDAGQRRTARGAGDHPRRCAGHRR
jgi:hypothetical protein